MRPFDLALLREVPESRRPVALLAAVGVAQAVAGVATAFALASLVVAVASGMPVTRPGLALTAVFVVRGLLAFAGERLAAAAGTTVSASLRERLLVRWLAPDPTALASTACVRDSGRDPRQNRGRKQAARDTALATQGAASAEPYVARYLPALVTAAVAPALAVTALVLVDWLSALIVVLTLPLLPVFAALIGATTRDATQHRWRALSDLSGHFLDVMKGLPTLVSYGRAQHQVSVVGEVSQAHRRATLGTLRLAFLSSAALELLATICVAIVAVTVGIRLAHGSMPLDTALVAILLAPEAYWPIRRVGAEFHNAADGAEALTKILASLASPDPDARTNLSAGADANPPELATLRARGLRFTYPGSESAVLDRLDLEAGPGLTVVTGPSGAGKSTLLHLLAGLLTPDTGTVTAPRTHLVAQRPFLTAGSVRANLALGVHPAPSTEHLWAALRVAGLDGVVAAMPAGMDSPLGDEGEGLSAGQRARLALARAWLSDASVVLLDEPTAHLDESSAALAHSMIRTMAERRCLLVVTHRPELVQLAERHVTVPARAGATA